MATLIRIGPVGDPSELEALRCLEGTLSDQYLVLANGQIPEGGQLIEVDALVVGAPGVFIIEIKNWRGKVVGSEMGAWTNDGIEVKNPIQQVKTASRAVKNFLQEKGFAKKIFLPDPRVALSIRSWAVVMFFNNHVDLSGVSFHSQFAWLLGCMTTPALIAKIAAMHDMTMHRLKLEEIRNIAYVLGAPKDQVDAWFARQNGQIAPAPAKSEQTNANAAPSPIHTRVCGRCSEENKADAKFCKKCGQKF